MMLISLFLLAFGLAILVFGANLLIKSSCAISQKLNISALIVGLTVVAFGTSAPELFISIGSAIQDNADFAIGNVVGSNIFNILGIIGIAVIIKPITFSRQLVNREMPIMLFVLALFYIMALSGTLTRIHGIILFTGIFIYVAYLILDAHSRKLIEAVEVEQNWGIMFALSIFLLGLIAMIGSSQLIITQATLIAKGFGVSDLVIGVSILAVGTSLPELAATLAATKRGQPDLAIGNAVGSNIFNVLTVIGLSSIIQPLTVNPVSLDLDFSMMFFSCFVVWLLVLVRKTLGRIEGVLMLASYVAYVVYLVRIGAIS